MQSLINYIIYIELYLIRNLQTLISKSNGEKIMYLSKKLTRRKNYIIYMIIILLTNFNNFYRTFILLYTSRYINSYLKNSIRESRPINHNSKIVTIIDKSKYSYSFPSQSIQTYLILYFGPLSINYFKIIIII